MSALPGMQNLNYPATHPGPLSQADVDRKEAELAVWHMLAEPLFDPDDAPMAEQDPWWFRWIFWPLVVILTVLACFQWPIWVAP